MASRGMVICLSSGSDSDDPATSAQRESTRCAAAAREAKLRAEAYERDVAAAIAVGTGPNAVKKSIVNDAQTRQLVSSYRRHYHDFCVNMRARNKRITQDFPHVVWEKVYGDFKTRFPDVTLEQSALKARLRAGLRDPSCWQSALSVPPVHPTPVTPATMAATPAAVSTSRRPAAPVRNQQSIVSRAQQPLTISGNANPQAPSEVQAQQIGTESSDQSLGHERSVSPQEEQYDESLKRRAKDNHNQLKKLKKQKLALKSLKLALELEIMSREECLAQGEFIVEMLREQRGIESSYGDEGSMAR